MENSTTEQVKLSKHLSAAVNQLEKQTKWLFSKEVIKYKLQLALTKFPSRQAKIYKFLNDFLVKNISETLTSSFNNKTLNNQAVNLLSKMQSKNLVSLINARQEKWDDNHGKTSDVG